MPRKPNWKVCRDKDTGSTSMRIYGNWSIHEDATRLQQTYDTSPHDTNFMATLLVKSLTTLNSQRQAVLLEEFNSNATHHMDVDDFVELVKHHDGIEKGVLSGVWGFKKQGHHQTIYLVEAMGND